MIQIASDDLFIQMILFLLSSFSFCFVLFQFFHLFILHLKQINAQYNKLFILATIRIFIWLTSICITNHSYQILLHFKSIFFFYILTSDFIGISFIYMLFYLFFIIFHLLHRTQACLVYLIFSSQFSLLNPEFFLLYLVNHTICCQ